MKQCVFIITMCFLATQIVAQSDSLQTTTEGAELWSNWRTKTFVMPMDTLYLDSLSILPHTVSVKNSFTQNTIDSSFYTLTSHELIWIKQPNVDKITVQYRVLPYALDATRFHIDTSWIGLGQQDAVIGFEYNPYENLEESLKFEKLNYTGSFSRSIAFGNNQDLVLNSGFNLQLSGNLGDDIEILAAISDNTIPIQPDGNTQQLNEFDKLFIQLKRKNSYVIAGDYELARPKSYFMNYFKKLQGIKLGTTLNFDENHSLNTSGSLAISRGKFGRNILTLQEGNQGPYKLKGNDGERFIIIQAGTERVFIDGKLATRGLEHDYVIDYNRGEIRFTTNLLITKDLRISVEFEYSDLTYTRSMYAYNADYQKDKWSVSFNLFSEQDGKNTTEQNSLSDSQKETLVDIGDDVGSAFGSGIDTLEEGFNPERIMYKLVDTTVNTTIFSQILVYSTNPDSAKYIARFSDVGAGMGHYIIAQSAANGRVYAWVAPDSTGRLQGNYEPIIQLVAPAQQQLYTLGTAYELGKNGAIKAEMALSNRDLNRFSDKDSQDNIGLAGKLGYEQNFTLSDSGKKSLVLTTQADYEWRQESFNPLSPYRPREFTRDWNTTNLAATQEHLMKAGIGLKKRGLGQLSYQFSSFLKDSLYTGFRHFGTAKMNQKGFDIRLEGNYLQTESQVENTSFFRPKLSITKKFKKLNNWEVGVYGEREQNKRNAVNETDSLLSTSFYYDLFRTFIESPESEKFKIRTSYQKRIDYTPLENNFTQTTNSDEIQLQGHWRQSKASTLRWNLTYRNLEVADTSLTTLKPQESYLGRMDYSLNLAKGAIRSTTSYEIGSGQEQKIEYNYLLVNAGDGVYTWIDRNMDSIKQVDEFEVAIFQDQANYLRLITFSDEYIRTNTLNFNQSLNLNPKAVWHKKKGFLKFVSRFATQSSIQINRKVRDLDGVSPWNPFQLNVADSALVSVTANIRNILYFNRSHQTYGIEVGQFSNRNRVILTTGFESRERQEQFFRFRWNVNSSLNLELRGAIGVRANDSEFFDNKDYNIRLQKLTPKLTFLRKQHFRSTLAYEFKNSKNTIGTIGETSKIHDFSLELSYNKASKSSIRSKLSFVSVDFVGLPNTPVSFVLLEGLQNGKNYLWTLSWDRQLAKFIQLNLGYEGRKTGEAKMVHVGRASVRATF